MRFTFLILLFCCLGADAQMIIKAHPNYVPFAVGVTPPLDTYTGAAAAYSLRKLRTAYTGSAIRVRRSNDNTEQDIGFIGDNLDTASLKTFVGANSGFVTTWYDQSGNARNATQSTAANQPRIVNVGVLEYGYNNKVAIRFDGSNDNFSASSLSSFLSRLNSNSVISVTSVNTSGEAPVIQSAISSSDRYIYGFASNSFSSSIFNGTSFVGKSISITRFIAHLNEAYYTPTNFDSYNNNVVATGANSMGSGATATTIIGARTTLVNFYAGWMQEIILYPTNQLSNRTGISNNLNTYWTIY